MKKTEEYAILDDFRLAAAFLVVAIHIGPFSCISETLDFYLTYVIGRIGVPFYLMVTGYFVLSDFERKVYFKKVWRFAGRVGLLYLAVTVLYLPLAWYAGNLPETLWEALRALVLDGTFYHLWYLPAVMSGCLITAFLLSFLRPAGAFAVTLFLYLTGVFGDSWYGLAVQAPPLRALYAGLFEVGSYTRNGLFFAPVFLCTGAMLANGFACGIKRCTLFWGCGISFCVLLAEGGFTRFMGWQRHNSMYISLFPVLFFGFLLLLRLRGKETALRRKLCTEEMPVFFRHIFSPVFLRKTAVWVWLLHPLFIVLVRGAAGVLRWESVMVDQSLILYLEVCVMSSAAGVICTLIKERTAKLWRRGENGYVQKRESVD